MRTFTFDPLMLICTPIAIYILSLEFNVNFWMVMLAATLMTVRMPFKWTY